MRATGLDQMPHVERDDDDDMHICIFGDKPITMSMTEQMRVLRIRLEQVARSPPTDLIQNFILKVRMLICLRHSQQKCSKLGFLRQNRLFSFKGKENI